MDDPQRQLTRLFLIANLLEVGGIIKGGDLAAACQVTLRTINRDLNLLRAAGACISYDKRRGSYFLDRPLPCQTINLATSDILALALNAASLSPNAPHAAPVRRTLEKLTARLPLALRETLREAQQVVQSGTPLRRAYTGSVWRPLLEAASRHETLELDYYSLSQDRLTRRRVDPYYLVMPQGYFQLVGWCHSRQEVRLFALDGIRNLNPTGQKFEKLAGFSLHQWMEGSLGTLRGEPTEIVVRFEAHIARWAQRRVWPFRHTLSADPEHTGAVLLRGTVSGVEEIKRELLSWGAGAEVLEPPALRDLMRCETEAMLANYTTGIS